MTMDSDSSIQLQRFQNDADSSPGVRQMMTYQNAADNYITSSAIKETVIQRNPKDGAEEKERQKELAEENKNAFHDAMIKNSGLLSAALMLDLLGGCGIFTGSAMAYQMAAAGTFEAAASVHDNLSFEQSFVNVTSSVLSSGVSSLT